MLKIGLRAQLYHQFTAYDNVIAYDQLYFVVVDMEAMLYYIDARGLCQSKQQFDVMHSSVQTCGCTIVYFVRPHLAFIVFSGYYFYRDVVSSAIPQACYTSNSCCSMFLTYSEANSYYWQGVLSPSR